MKNIIVDKKHDGKSLITFLFDKFPDLSSNTLYKALRKKDIRINNIRISKDTLVYTGDEVKLYIVDELLCPQYIPDIIYEDKNILVANKPVGIEVLGKNSFTDKIKIFINSRIDKNMVNTNNLKTLSNIFLEPCHRLDRNTSGLIIFAKNSEALKILLDKFKNHEIEKHYVTKVHGIPKLDKKTLHAYLFKDSKKSVVYISDTPQKGYVNISTSYSIIEKNKELNYSILDVTLHTGRTHQIRAHLSHIGHPILGDGKYGSNKVNTAFGYKTQQLCSYLLFFNFSSDSGILNYLNGKKIILNNNPIINSI